MTVKVVTDSTSDLSPQIANELGISVVPLNVHFGEVTYRDGIDLSAEEFFQKLVNSPILPTTTQPSVGAFLEVYNALAEETDEIVSIHISAKLSGTYNSALVAKNSLEKSCRIEIVDSLQATMATGLIVIAAAKAAKAGANLDEVLAVIEDAISRIRIRALLDTLEYLQKGGRIGKAKAFLGTILKVKPLIKLEEGEVHPVEQVRTRARAIQHLCDFVASFPHISDMAIMHSTTPEEADALAERLDPIFPKNRVYISRFGPVIGTYTGPGALGIALLEGEP
ncbi:MAG: hypothetical protein A2Y60_00545 [Chloroflexi bacterium RBG_13_54_9]|nr:MAG: hypothetical protein A2Y60_00545 [Chloroflexi bacterium RBG_13_54_9]